MFVLVHEMMALPSDLVCSFFGVIFGADWC